MLSNNRTEVPVGTLTLGDTFATWAFGEMITIKSIASQIDSSRILINAQDGYCDIEPSKKVFVQV